MASAITAQYGTSHSNHVIIAHNIVRNAGVTADDVTGVPGHGIMALTSNNIQILNNIVVGSRQWGIAAATIRLADSGAQPGGEQYQRDDFDRNQYERDEPVQRRGDADIGGRAAFERSVGWQPGVCAI